MRVRVDSLAIARYVERMPGNSCSHGALAREFVRRGYDPVRFGEALAACIRDGLLVADFDRDGVEVPR